MDQFFQKTNARVVCSDLGSQVTQIIAQISERRSIVTKKTVRNGTEGSQGSRKSNSTLTLTWYPNFLAISLAIEGYR